MPVHFQPDTLPRVQRHPDGATVDLVLPFRFALDTPDPAGTWVLRATVDGGACAGVVATIITPALVEDLRKGMEQGGNGSSTDAEDFVVAETVQLRNAHVYLAVAIWADWAARPGRRGRSATTARWSIGWPNWSGSSTRAGPTRSGGSPPRAAAGSRCSPVTRAGPSTSRTRTRPQARPSTRREARQVAPSRGHSSPVDVAGPAQGRAGRPPAHQTWRQRCSDVPAACVSGIRSALTVKSAASRSNIVCLRSIACLPPRTCT